MAADRVSRRLLVTGLLGLGALSASACASAQPSAQSASRLTAATRQVVARNVTEAAAASPQDGPVAAVAPIISGVGPAATRSAAGPAVPASPAEPAVVAPAINPEPLVPQPPAAAPRVSSSPVPVAAGDPGPPAGELGMGAQGPAVIALETRLDALRYDVGELDGVFDRTTAHAVMAFQKVQGLERTGRATDDVVAAIHATVGLPPPMAPNTSADRVEVDLARQVLFLYRDGSLAVILPVSSGNRQRFCSQGYCRRAITPEGTYSIYRQGGKVERGPLGVLYRPQYFNGGIAIHGSPSVPAAPASHGCVRIPMNASVWFPGQVSVGTQVTVVSGPGPGATVI